MSADDVSPAVLAERIAHERELREAQLTAFDHERELRTLFDAHERELRQQNEAAVEKARQLQFEVYESRLEHMNEFRAQLTVQAGTFLSVDRFEREHRALIERMDAAHSRIDDRLGIESAVTTRQDAQHDLLEQSQTNHRWLVGISIGIIGVALSSSLALVALLFHLAGLY